MALSRTLAAFSLMALAGCLNEPIRPIVPLTPEATAGVYDATLQEIRHLLAPADSGHAQVRWDHVYLNSRILLPPDDSASPLLHDPEWLASVRARGLVNGVCGMTGPMECPDSIPLAFVSLSVPWTRGGDTAYVQGGFVGHLPQQQAPKGIFWEFMVIKKDGSWQVAQRGEPNPITFRPDPGRRS